MPGEPQPAEGSALTHLAVVQHVAEVGRLPLDAAQTLREVLTRLCGGLGASSAVVLVRACSRDDPAGQQTGHPTGSFSVRAAVGLADVAASSGAWTTAAEVVRTGAPVLRSGLPVEGPDRASVAAVPLHAAGDLLGVLQVQSRRPAAFEPDDLTLLALVGDRVALAVERLQLADRERAATAALRESEQRARAVLETAVDGIVTVDHSGRVESMNPAAERMFGRSAAEVVGQDVGVIMPQPGLPEHLGYLERYHRSGERRVSGIGRELVGQRADGSTFPLELAVSEVGSDLGLYTGVLRDITERKQFEEQLARQALHDPLTGLANRALLLERLEAALQRLPRHAGVLALLFLDLDRFKLVNDTLGHEAGDELLRQASDLLRRALREEDLIARLGGDEFVVLCADLPGAEEVERVAARVTDALNVPVVLRGREVFLSASVGVVTAAVPRPAADLLRDADVAMYQAKEQGRGRYTLLDDAARAGLSDRLQLSTELRRALERDELRVVYQPLVDLRSGAVVAAEALLRWQHPQRGLLSPAAFLALAHEVGAVPGFDRWVLHTACRAAAEWGRRLPRRLGLWVNLSSSSLADPGLPATVSAALEETGLDPQLLTLEITEDTLMRDASGTVRVVQGLRALGVQLAVDDFGTGYSSLAYLQQFPVHTLKVDRSFVGRLDDEVSEDAGASGAIVQAVVNLAAGLRLRTVAEGIETPGQLAAATALGCDLGQGWFLGRPASASDVLRAAASGVLLAPAVLDLAGLDVAPDPSPDTGRGTARGTALDLKRAAPPAAAPRTA